MKILIQQLEDIEDPRSGNATVHNLADILFIAIAATVADADSWYEVVDYAKMHEDFFRQYLELPGGIPSHDTFNRVFAIMDPLVLEKHYQEWIELYRQKYEGQVICIDGKTIKGANTDQHPVHMVSAFASEEGISLGQLRVDDKKNELDAIPKLLDMINVKRCTVTIDAMGCQKNIAKKIIEKKGHYVLAVKGNQGSLHEAAMETARMVKPDSIHKEVDADHGRVEERICRVYGDLSFVQGSWNWEGLRSLVEVTRVRYSKKSGKESTEKAYYITSLPCSKAERIAGAIRSHWKVENQLHWVLDVGFNEDASMKRVGNAAENFARLRRIALNLIRHDQKREGGMDKPLKRKRKAAAWSTKILECILFSLPYEQ